eukprot:7600591-Pyramimonas_sp.AAC.1
MRAAQTRAARRGLTAGARVVRQWASLRRATSAAAVVAGASPVMTRLTRRGRSATRPMSELHRLHHHGRARRA